MESSRLVQARREEYTSILWSARLETRVLRVMFHGFFRDSMLIGRRVSPAPWSDRLLPGECHLDRSAYLLRLLLPTMVDDSALHLIG